jgi:putative transposase
MTDIQPELTPALEAYLVGLIYRNTRTSCLSLAELCGHVSHDSLNRLLRCDLPWSRRLWEEFSSAMVTPGGYLLLDDTTWRRRARKAEAVSWVWSSSAAHIVRGMQVVLLVWTDGGIKVPVGMRLWQKGGKSKVALAEELLREARAHGIAPKYVLFDSWYAAGALLNALEEFGWKYVARLKSNRLLSGVAVRERWRHRFGRAVGRLRKVSHEVLVVKDGRRYFVTNDAQLTSREVKTAYRIRQQIEETFRLLKQEFGWGGSSARKAAAQVAHLHLGLYALCMVERAAIKGGQTIYAFKHKLFRLPIPDHLPQLDAFSVAA